MILHVGHIPPPQLEDTNKSDGDAEISQGESTNPQPFRSLVVKQAGNIQQLIPILVQNAPLFFDPITHPVVVGLVHAIITMPLQTNCHVALFLRIVHEKPEFAHSALQYSFAVWARLLDSMLLLQSQVYTAAVQAPHSLLSCRLLLRFWVLVSQHSSVLAWKPDEDDDADPFDPVVASTHALPLPSVRDLLQSLVQASKNARERHSNPSAAALLANLVLSCFPYIANDPAQDSIEDVAQQAWISEHVVEPLQAVLVNEGSGTSSYGSLFAPGVGSCSILLRREQDEGGAFGGGDGDEDGDEEDQDDDDDSGEAPGQVCDNLQDLMRTVAHLARADGTGESQCLLYRDQPWRAFEVSSNEAEKSDEAEAAMAVDFENAPAYMELLYKGSPVHIRVFPECKSLTLLLGGEAAIPAEAEGSSRYIMNKSCLLGVLTGRLPIFGPPPDLEDDDEDDDDEGGTGESAASASPRLVAYKQLRLVDRYFLAEAVRDVILSQESLVTDAGVERSSCKAVAEHVWSIASLMQNDGQGFEYCIVETILGLITQAERPPVSPFRVIYLSRVLLELTRLAPAILSPAVAAAVQILVNDYMPSLVPIARQNLAQWFAYHLINTDYQWPEAYWKHWSPFVLQGWRNSRGSFILSSLSHLVENTSHPDRIVRLCLPLGSGLADFLVPVCNEALPVSLKSFADDIRKRIWDYQEDAGVTLSYVCSEEVAESVFATMSAEHQSRFAWWRTAAVVRAILAPVTSETEQRRKLVDDTRGLLVAGDDTANMCEDDDENATDSMSSILDLFRQYQALLVGVLAKDADGFEFEEESLATGEVALLREIESVTCHSRALLDVCVQTLLQNDMVRPLSVVRWTLTECRPDSEKTNGGMFLARWWDLATTAIEFSCRAALNLDPEAMEDSDSSSPSKRIMGMIGQLEPLLACAVEQVAKFLSEAGPVSSRLSPSMVDLIEGLKRLILRSRVLLLEGVDSSSNGDEPVDDVFKAKEALSQSPIASPALCALLGEATLGQMTPLSALHNALMRFEILDSI
jgi:hypothetical protein